MGLLKQGYVAAARVARRGASGTGLLSAFERRAPTSRMARWARSLFAIYDLDDMVRLDLPWWTLDAIEAVDAFLAGRPGARVFEYGSGASTVWLARRAASVTSVEHDAPWHETLSRRLRDHANVNLILKPPDPVPHPDSRYSSTKSGWTDRTFHDYVRVIDGMEGAFDLIVVDGRARPACLEAARPRLAPGGVIVFDNSNRPASRQAIAASGMSATRLGGLAACLPYPDETTLLRRA